MILYVLRHGEAEEKGPKWASHDHDRPLTKEGIQKFERAVKGLKRLEMQFDRVLSSPFVRARQTAEILVRGFGMEQKLELTEHLTPTGEPRELTAQLRKVGKKYPAVVLVGHEPYLSGLIGQMISGSPGCAITLKKGGICKLEAERPDYSHCAALKWLLTQRQLRAIAGT
jgi:phosphohistidine phosphatase